MMRSGAVRTCAASVSYFVATGATTVIAAIATACAACVVHWTRLALYTRHCIIVLFAFCQRQEKEIFNAVECILLK